MEFAPMESARQHGVAARRANAGRTMPIRETHPRSGKFIEIRRRNFGVRILNPQIAVAHIVGVEDDDVRSIRKVSAFCFREEKETVSQRKNGKQKSHGFGNHH